MASEFSYQFTETARNDLDEALDYIANRLCNPTAAKNLWEELMKSVALFTQYPESGAPVDNPLIPLDSVRKIHVKNDTVFYCANHDTESIVILRVVYSHRNLDEIITSIGIQ